MKPINFGDIPTNRSRQLWPSYYDTECEVRGCFIAEDDPVGFVQNEKACEDCWEQAG